MNFRMKLGGDDRPHDNVHYTEGYNTGFAAAMDEMRRRTRSYADDHEDIENRRGRRARGYVEEYDPPASNKTHWPIETRQIGFDTEDRRTRNDTEALMRMMDDLKEGQQHIMRGMAATVKKLDPRMEALLETAAGVLENPPSTWEPHMKRGDYLGIAKMEGKELLNALEAHKSEKDMRKELSHTLAALLQLTTAH